MANEKIAVFIDGANLHDTSRRLEWRIDYKRFRKKIESLGYVVRIKFYTAVRGDGEFTQTRKLVDWLKFNGFDVVTKDIKVFTDEVTGEQKVKGNCDVELAVDMMRMASKVDHMYLVSGDGDFISAVTGVQDEGTRVTVISTMKTPQWMINNELRAKADAFIEICDWRQDIEDTRAPTVNEFSLKRA